MTIAHVDNAIINALAGKSNLDESILSIRGFSTPTMRHLFNNICNIKEGNYLEVGLYCGATFCSSFNKDTVSIGVEDFSQGFGVNSVQEELEKNVKNNWSVAKDVHLFNVDCFNGKLNYQFQFDIYFYDGEHSEESQAKALPHFIDSMADRFLFIVDDTNWESVKQGTTKGFEQLEDKINLEMCWVLKGEKQQDDPVWHNGMAIFLISKK